MEKAVVLLSGGLDSATCMAVAKEQEKEPYPISFDYQQRHSIELVGAKKIAAFYKVKKHLLIKTNMGVIGGSALTDGDIAVPQRDVSSATVPVTYVPARNLIFLSYALGYAEVLGAYHIYIGVNSVDYSGYPDCRPEFIEHFQAVADYSTPNTFAKKRIEIVTPLQHLSKAEIVRLAARLDVPIELTRSRYKGGKKACGVCDSCKLRLKGFLEAGIKDPIDYEKR